MREIPLTMQKGGLSRLRIKGGARADTLYDFVNGYLTVEGTAVARPGTFRENTLDARTRGLVAFNGTRHVFCAETVTVPDGYTLNVLHHPDATDYAPIALERIHFAAPIMGALYVAAEFEDGNTYHYWLQEVPMWEQETHYFANAMVTPTVLNGLAYQASRLGDPYPAWAAGVPRYDGLTGSYQQSIIEPTVYNDFFYTCELVGGTNPRSGDTEPTWPLEEGAQVIEYADGGDPTEQPAPPTPPSADIPQETIRDRYERDFR